MNRLSEFDARFRSEKQCLEFLYQLRWPDGYRCPRCFHSEAWQIKEWKFKCRKCGYQSTVTAGTIFQDSHLPIAVWFKAIWYICSQKGGVNALDLQKELDLGSYRTAWTMLLKIRKLMADKATAKLGGTVAVGSYAISKKSTASREFFWIAAKLQSNGNIGEVCIEYTPYINNHTLFEFMKNHIILRSFVFTEENPYGLRQQSDEYIFLHLPPKNYDRGCFSPPIYKVIKHLEDNGLFSHSQLLSPKTRLNTYLDECCYKFNRRNKSTMEMFNELLYSAVRTDPLTYGDIVIKKQKAPQN